MPLVYVEGDDPAQWPGGEPGDEVVRVGVAALGSDRGMWGSAENETFAAVMKRMIRRAETLQQCERLGHAAESGPICCVMGSFASDASEAALAADHGLLTPDELATAQRYAAWFEEHVCPGPSAVVILKEPRFPNLFTPGVSAAAARRAEADKGRLHVMVEDRWSDDTPVRFAAFLSVVNGIGAGAERVRCGLPLNSPADGAAPLPPLDPNEHRGEEQALL